MDNGGFQVLFQNGSETNPASHAMGTVDIFSEFKTAEARRQTATHGVEFENECCCTSSAERQLYVFQGRFFEEFL
jgi:hypothetical protein